MSQPYTHAMHAHRCHQMALERVATAGLRVQVQKRGVTYCGRIAGCWTTPDNVDCWTVETTSPQVSRFTVPVRQVRECGQADCTCLAEPDRGELATHEAALSGSQK